MSRWIYFLIMLLACGFVKPALAVGIAPATFELESASGVVLKEELKIINTKDIDQTYYLNLKQFTAPDNESGSPKFTAPDKNQPGLSEWLSFENKAVIIPARSFAQIPFFITIPAGTPPGSYFTAVIVGETPAEIVATNGATIQAETASLIFLTVTGETKLAGAILDFQVEPIDPNQIFGTYKYRIQNQGNVYFTPEGTITFKDLLGRTLTTVDANQIKGKILPNSTRTFAGNFGQENGKTFFELLNHQFSVFAIGPITANLKISLGENYPSLNASETFWYIPWEMLGLLVLTFVFVAIAYLIAKKEK